MIATVPRRLLGLATSLLLLAGCQHDPEPTPSITHLVVTTADFSELEDAAIRGNVAVTLSNPNPAPGAEGNYTVFAPNNAAFARLGLRTANDLLALDRTFLTNTLLYHVGNGAVPSSTLQPGYLTPAVSGPMRRIVERGGQRYVNGSRIVATDVTAANGTVHVIDKVLLATSGDIVQSAVALTKSQVFVQPELTFLVEAVLYTNLAGALSAAPGSPQLTVFAPNDQAFKDLLTQLLGISNPQPADIRRLPQSTVAAVLLHHVVPGGQFTSELPENTTVQTAGNTTLRLGAFANGVLPLTSGATSADMVVPDVQCTNGVVHVIDHVLLP